MQVGVGQLWQGHAIEQDGALLRVIKALNELRVRRVQHVRGGLRQAEWVGGVVGERAPSGGGYKGGCVAAAGGWQLKHTLATVDLPWPEGPTSATL